MLRTAWAVSDRGSGAGAAPFVLRHTPSWEKMTIAKKMTTSAIYQPAKKPRRETLLFRLPSPPARPRIISSSVVVEVQLEGRERATDELDAEAKKDRWKDRRHTDVTGVTGVTGVPRRSQPDVMCVVVTRLELRRAASLLARQIVLLVRAHDMAAVVTLCGCGREGHDRRI